MFGRLRDASAGRVQHTFKTHVDIINITRTDIDEVDEVLVHIGALKRIEFVQGQAGAGGRFDQNVSAMAIGLVLQVSVEGGISGT